MHPRHAPKRIENGRWLEISLPASCCFACVTTRERERERGERRGEGVVIAFKVPLGISKVSDKFFPSFFSRAEKFSYSTLRRPLFPSCANFEQLYIYVCVCVWSSVDTFSSTSQTRPILVNFERVAVAFVWTAFQKCLFDFTFTAFLFFFLSSIFNPIFLFLSLESRDEVILREPTRKLPNFRSFSFIFSLEITRSTMFMRSYKSSRSLVISNPFASILSGFRFNKIFPRKRIGKKAQLSFFYFIHPICIIYDVQYDQKFHFNFIQMFLPWYLSHLNLDALAQAENSNI